MTVFEWPLWILLGAGAALLFLSTQKWSVKQITPDKPAASMFLILGGAVLRWIMIALVLVLALMRSPVAALLVFAAFMIARLVILIIWEKQWRVAAVQTSNKKD